MEMYTWFSIFDKAAKEFAMLLMEGHSVVYIIQTIVHNIRTYKAFNSEWRVVGGGGVGGGGGENVGFLCVCVREASMQAASAL